MTKEELKALYEGKYFYEIVSTLDGIKLEGPYDNIRYLDPVGTGFAQIINGEAVQMFTPDEILVTDRQLGKVKTKYDIIDCSTPQAYCSGCSCGKKERIEGKQNG